MSDLHLGHKRILEFSGEYRDGDTVEEHNEILLDKINRTVNPSDHLWLLGDCVMGGKQNLPLLGRIRCENMKLVMGNHDSSWNVRDYLPYFVDIKGVVNEKEFLLSHIPVTNDNDLRYSRMNIHGHTHRPEFFNWETQRNVNVGVEALNGWPIDIQDIRAFVQLVKDKKGEACGQFIDHHKTRAR